MGYPVLDCQQMVNKYKSSDMAKAQVAGPICLLDVSLTTVSR